MDRSCRCNCGYTCGGRGVCKEPLEVCMRDHYKRDCDHKFEGWRQFEGGGTTVCVHCGLEAITHDMMVGP